MPSFDIVSEISGHEIRNAVENANRELTNRWDFRNVQGAIVDAQYKAQTLQQLAQQFNIATENTVAIGDGANDLAMMQVANLGVAYHAKPKVQQLAQVIVNFTDLTALLCLLSANDKMK